ncbi:hypothetical protein N9L06_00365 [Mariniblastus sp.]|nr:hypothetical protein [Mariniblastus sp.]
MNQFKTQTHRPYMIIGAGDLVFHVHRAADENTVEAYRFNMFRTAERGEVLQSFRPSDLRSFIKACQVLSFEMAADGWMSGELREELIQLSTELDEITFSWSNENG